METEKRTRTLSESSDTDSTKKMGSPETLLNHIKHHSHFLATSSSMKIKNETSEDNDIQVLEEESAHRKSKAHSELMNDLSQDKPFQCTECDYKCTSRDKLKRHFMIHTGEKPYECNYCDYRCARSDKLKRHMMVHTGEKPFECSECDYKTARNDKLKTHVMKHILGKIPRKTSIPSNVSHSSMHKVPLSSVNDTHSTKSAVPKTVLSIADSIFKSSCKTKDSDLANTTTKYTTPLDNFTGNSSENKNNHSDKIKPIDKTPDDLETLKSSKGPSNSSPTRESFTSSNPPKESNPHLSNARSVYSDNLETLKSNRDPSNLSSTRESVSSVNPPKNCSPHLSNARNMYAENSSPPSSLNSPKGSSPHLSNARNMYTENSSPPSSLNLPKGGSPHLSNVRNIYAESSSQEMASQIKPPEYFYHSNLPPREKIHYDQNSTVPSYHYGSPWIENPVPVPVPVPVRPDMVTLTPINSAAEFRHGMPTLPLSHLADSSSMSQNYHQDNRILNNPMHHPAVGKVPPYMLGAYE